MRSERRDISPEIAEAVITEFLKQNGVYDQFNYGLKYCCSTKRQHVKDIHEYVRKERIYTGMLYNAFSWRKYEDTEYGKHHAVDWWKLSMMFKDEFDDLVEKHGPKVKILQALEVIR